MISLAALWIELGFLASIVSFGALVAFSAVNLTVIKHYYIDGREERAQQHGPAAHRLRADGVAVVNLSALTLGSG